MINDGGHASGSIVEYSTRGSIRAYPLRRLHQSIRSSLSAAAVTSLACLLLMSGCSSSPGATDNYPLAGVPQLKAQPRDGFVELSWSEATNALEYRLYWSTSPGVTKETGNVIPVTGQAYKHEQLRNNQTYYYAAAAVGLGPEGDLSAEVSAVPIPPPDEPQRVVATIQDGAISVSWLAIPDATSYEVYAASDELVSAATYQKLPDGIMISTTANAVVHSGFDDTKTYYVVVVAINASGSSHESTVTVAAPAAVSISAGGNHVCAIKLNHSLWCWGANNYGQLGIGDNARRYVPTQVGADRDWLRVSAGGDHTCAIKIGGNLFCWGRKTTGELGAPTGQWKTSPVQIGAGRAWITVASGRAHTCAIDEGGELWCWGSNVDHQVGVVSVSSNDEPQNVMPGVVWNSVSTGDAHTCAVRTEGALLCWGNNAYGQLGSTEIKSSDVPRRVGDEVQWAAIAAGANHNCALKTDTSLWCWGRNSYGQLGVGTEEWTRGVPTRVGNELGWADVALGQQHSCATRVDGRLRCWGANLEGQLPVQGTDNHRVPVEIDSGVWWHQVALGDSHTCALAVDGTYGCWGRNSEGQRGDGVPTNNPQPVTISPDGDWATVVAGWYHTCGLKQDQSLWCWGGNAFSGGWPRRVSNHAWTSIALADSRACALRQDRTLWCSYFFSSGMPWFDSGVQEGDESTTWRRVVIQRNGSFCALKADRTIWCSSGGGYGAALVQLGTDNDWESIDFVRDTTLCAIKVSGTYWCQNGATMEAKNDTFISFSSESGCALRLDGSSNCLDGLPTEGVVWTSVSTSSYGTCAVRADASLWCWGYFLYTYLSGRVGADNNWVSVSVGEEGFACARRTNGTLWCWGQNLWGQLGNQDEYFFATTPMSVGSESTWRSITAGLHHTCAVATVTQQLHCWGNNSYGQLGNGSSETSIPTPVSVGLSGDWLSVAAGAYHTCGVRLIVGQLSGPLWCWGANGNGQLGVGDTAPDGARAPTQVGSDGDWQWVTAGDYHTCARKMDNSLWCWGANGYGQVGNNKKVDQFSPELIGDGSSWRTVAAGGNHSCAIRIESDLYCWGANDRGQLGINSTQSSLIPSPVSTSEPKIWIDLGAGAEHTCATTGYELWCWGDNRAGQLAYGNDVTTMRLVPGKSIGWRIVNFSLGARHTCLTYVGQSGVFCSGANDAWQLGDGTNTPKSSPTLCPLNTSWSGSYTVHLASEVAAGGKHTCATRDDGTLACWGDNTDGQIGVDP